MRTPKFLSMLVTLVSILALALVCIPLPGCLNYYDPGKACNGYTLISNDTVAKLLDMNGNVVKFWNLNSYPAKMFPDGSVMGQGGFGMANLELTKIVQLSWDGETEWEFSGWDEVDGAMSARVHHDFQKDGSPVGYYAPGQEPAATGGKVLVLGRLDVVDPEISSLPLLDDVVYEVDWDTKQAIKLWLASEHFDELGFSDAAKQLVYNHGGDYLHINCVSRIGPNHWYDPDTGSGDVRFHPDNLIMDSRESNIIWIVNMVEGTGYDVGEICWKVGPDYSAGTLEGDRLGQIVGQHHAHMIPAGLPGEGNILVFDNGGVAGYPFQYRWYSRVLEFDPVTLELLWEYKDPSFFSFYISSTQRLPNGNTLIDEGSTGRIFEVTPAKEKVWEFVEGAGIQVLGRVYRAYRVPPEWVPGNPAGYKFWSELYESEGVDSLMPAKPEPAAGEGVQPKELAPESPLSEPEEISPSR